MPARPPLTLVVNPAATAVGAGTLERAVAELDRVAEVEVAPTEEPGHARALAAGAAARGTRLVVALGGDGTASEAANGLIGTPTALAALPGGGTSVFARTLGLGTDVPAAAAALARAISEGTRPRRVDTGVVDGRHFLFMSGIGITAAIMRHAAGHPRLRARLGDAYFALGLAAAIRAARRGDLPLLDVRAGAETFEGLSVLIVQNSDPLTFFGPRAIRICAGAGLGTGTLALAGARGAGGRAALGIVGRLLTGSAERVLAHERALGRAGCQEIVVTAADGRPFPVEVDGCYLAERTSVRYTIEPGSLLVLGAPCPANVQSPGT